MMHVDELVTRLALGQHGVFSTADLQRLGITSSARRHRLRHGRWVTIHEHVFAIAGAPLSWRGRLLAACLAGGTGAVASHRSAAALFGFPAMADDLVEITCRRWRRHHESWMVVHETRAFDLDSHGEIDGIPVTSPARTLLDLGAVCSPSVVEMCLDHAVRVGLSTTGELETLLDLIGRRGRNGTGVLRSILDARGGQGSTESPQETRLVRALRRHGFTGFVPQHEVRHAGRFVARVDIAFPERRVALEYESYQHHTGREALLRDSSRRNRLTGAGWSVITVTAADLRSFAPVSASLRAALATRGDAKTG
jgi:very-short-patch-repair endonuclease